jgi:hypothetical protein
MTSLFIPGLRGEVIDRFCFFVEMRRQIRYTVTCKTILMFMGIL